MTFSQTISIEKTTSISNKIVTTDIGAI